MTANPSISVVIPTYQRRAIVREAVRALCQSSYDGPLEIIVVVDGSTDGTADALAGMGCRFPLRIIEQANAGAASARNRGAADASGDILLFLDDDMMAMPDMVAEHAKSHRSGADAVLGHVPIDPASPPSLLLQGVQRWSEERERRLRDGGELGLFDLLTGQLSVKRALFNDIGGFDPAFTAGGAFGNEDVDFGLRLRERGHIEFNPDAISKQYYAVSPRQYLKQWAQAGRADVALSRKHPALAIDVLDQHAARRWVRPLAFLPLMPRVTGLAATRMAEHHTKLPSALRPLAAWLLSVARDFAFWAAVRDAGGIPASQSLLVLCYHAIADLSGDRILADYGVDRATFEAQLDLLRRRGFVFVGPDDAIALLDGCGRLPGNAVLLTFDDCYEELTEIARDLLKPRGIAAVALAVSGMRTATNEWDQAIGARRLRLLDAEGLRELSRQGVEIGCHSRSHRPLTGLSDALLARETKGAAADIAAAGLPPPRFFAYPHGESDERVRAAVQAAGFAAAFGLFPTHANAQSDRFNLPRVEILARDIGWRFELKTRWPRLSSLLDAGHIVHSTRAKLGSALRRLRTIPADR